MIRVRVGLVRTGGARVSAVITAPKAPRRIVASSFSRGRLLHFHIFSALRQDGLGQLLGHIEPRVAGRLAIYPGGDLPTPLQIETRRLKVERGQHRAGTAAPPCFFLCHGEDAATKPAAPQALRQKKPLNRQEAEVCTAQQAAGDLLRTGIMDENRERKPVRTSRLRLVVGAQPLRDHCTLLVIWRVRQRDRGFGAIGHGVRPPRLNHGHSLILSEAFYMRVNDDGRTIVAMDVLAPGIGEIIGGSQREERLDVLDARMTERDIDKEHYAWYRDLRRYGTVPHAGFGLGFERTLAYVTGLANVRDAIPFPRTPGNARY